MYNKQQFYFKNIQFLLIFLHKNMFMSDIKTVEIGMCNRPNSGSFRIIICKVYLFFVVFLFLHSCKLFHFL